MQNYFVRCFVIYNFSWLELLIINLKAEMYQENHVCVYTVAYMYGMISVLSHSHYSFAVRHCINLLKISHM